ncbi:hypothetical protein ACQKPE_03390 [Pseudomonas sp. NPDC089554]|uniref:hypothetical protein n=1 Tax=Pseudomonas sp. NPDC089554 TaxID=3390653 RepID=UPI003CFD0910
MTDQCKQSLEPGQSLCSVTHCESYRESSTMARWCKCKTWDGKPMPDCKPMGGNFPVETYNCYNKTTQERRNIPQSACQDLRDQNRDWSWEACYCCCSCFAWGTRITVAPDTYRIVQTIGLGDPVLTTRVEVVGGKPMLTWVSRAVTFSDGMAPAAHQPAVLLQYGDQGELTVTLDQPMLLANGLLKTADRLTTDDQLVDRDGQPVALHAVILGKFTIGFHSLTTQDFAQDVNAEWFLEANGVIAGDHMVLAMQDDESMAKRFVKGHDDLPRLGSKAYAKGRKDCTGNALLTARAREIANEAFLSMDELISGTSPVPFGATPYMTQKQAANVAVNGTFRSLGQTLLVPDFTYLTKVFNAFFPKVNFYLAWEDTHPNMFAFQAYGQNTVYLSGQLLRLEGMFKQGLAFLMAQGVARFESTTYTNDSGLVCTGLADYFGANQILQTVFYGSYGSWVNPGFEQIQGLFALIDEANRIGHEMCSTPSIPCRLESIEAAIIGMPLPPCAGGPVPYSLKLESARWTTHEGAIAVEAHFSHRLDLVSAKDIGHYRLTYQDSTSPGGVPIPLALVQIDINDPSRLWVIVDGHANFKGVVTLAVRDLYADNGSTLDPDASSVTVGGAP